MLAGELIPPAVLPVPPDFVKAFPQGRSGTRQDALAATISKKPKEYRCQTMIPESRRGLPA